MKKKGILKKLSLGSLALIRSFVSTFTIILGVFVAIFFFNHMKEYTDYSLIARLIQMVNFFSMHWGYFFIFIWCFEAIIKYKEIWK